MNSIQYILYSNLSKTDFITKSNVIAKYNCLSDKKNFLLHNDKRNSFFCLKADLHWFTLYFRFILSQKESQNKKAKI